MPPTAHLMNTKINLIHGDCIDKLKELESNSIHAIVTDPPYGLSFMGKRWDYDVPSVEVWAECLRVLKPGGHLLAFAGTRTQHRMAVRIEDAGFEIRDMIAWVYGSGFPKSLDVSKAIDKRGGNAHMTAEIGAALKAARKARGISMSQADRTYCGGVTLWSWYEGRPAGQQMPTVEVMAKVASDWPELQRYADLIAEAEREVVGRSAHKPGIANGTKGHRTVGGTIAQHVDITAPATPEAQQWAGWGTALKPALEPITVARKPFPGTVAANVLEHGTGALNVDGCRVGTRKENESGCSKTGSKASENRSMSGANYDPEPKDEAGTGRWPANLIHDGSDEVVGLFPQGSFNKPTEWKSDGDGADGTRALGKGVGKRTAGTVRNAFGDTGSAARFFYCAKASKADRGEGNAHPTVKPTELMRYLCRLVTPPNGIVLDPFMGSGSTGKAAKIEGFGFIGIEREAEYMEIARARIDAAKYEPPKPKQASLFNE